MNRKGTFTMNKSYPNQCKVKGHKDYTYHMKIIFNPRVKLDNQDFLIDHFDVDNCIQECKKTGSCENIHQQISDAILQMFKKRKISVVAIRCDILPDNEQSIAILSYIWTKSKDYTSMITL